MELPFFSIGTVEGAGNSVEENNYLFYDFDFNQCADVVYYRLKQVDFDGAWEYSPVRSLICEKEQMVSSFAIYPNPTKNVLYIESTNQAFEYSIYSIQGKLLLQNSNQNSVDLSKLSAGEYLIELRSTNAIKQERLIIIR